MQTVWGAGVWCHASACMGAEGCCMRLRGLHALKSVRALDTGELPSNERELGQQRIAVGIEHLVQLQHGSAQVIGRMMFEVLPGFVARVTRL